MKRFYDIHFHSMDLSHPNLLAFLERDDLITKAKIKEILKDVGPWYNLLPMNALRFVSNFVYKTITKKISEHKEYINLLSFIGSPIKTNLLLIEYFLKNKKSPIGDATDFTIGGEKYNKFVICPLIMDFGVKMHKIDGVFYNIPTRKPVQDQIIDVLNSIRFYLRHELIMDESKNKPVLIKSTQKKIDRLFEIYPFMGLNTQNYSYEKLEKMLNKYFSGFSNDTPEQRALKLYEKMGEFNSTNLEGEFDYNYLFAGIKVYPPLGFDPWPSDKEELKKVELLYNCCIDNNIPITSHCSDGGYKVVANARELTSPLTKWKEALDRYPKLKLNFAHLGNQQKSRDWENQIVKFAQDKEKNVYTDISCMANNDKYYSHVKKVMDNPGMDDKLLFGTDFVINLIWSKSYNDYINVLNETNHISNKHKLCSVNAENFLYGGEIPSMKELIEKELAVQG